MKYMYSLQIIDGSHFQKIPSIIIQYGAKKYVFNVPETTQRFIREHGIKINRGSKFFFTQVSTYHIAGISSVLTLLFNNKVGFGMKLYGPPGLCDYLDNLRFLMNYKLLAYSAYDFGQNSFATNFPNNDTNSINLHQSSHNPKPNLIRPRTLLGVNNVQMLDKILMNPRKDLIFHDINEYLRNEYPVMKEEHPVMQKGHTIVKKVYRVTKKGHKEEQEGDINDPEIYIKKDEDEMFKDEDVEIRRVLINNEERGRMVCSYICRHRYSGEEKMGKWKGDLIVGKMEKGKINPITSLNIPTTTTIMNQDIKADNSPKPTSVFIIIDCPNQQCMNNLVNQRAFEQYYGSSQLDNANQESLDLVVHLGPPEVILHPTYRSWMSKFPQSTEQLLLDPSFTDSSTRHSNSSNTNTTSAVITSNTIASTSISTSISTSLSKGTSISTSSSTSTTSSTNTNHLIPHAQHPLKSKLDSNLKINEDNDELKHIHMTNILHKFFPDYFPSIHKGNFKDGNDLDIQHVLDFLAKKSIRNRFHEFYPFNEELRKWSLNEGRDCRMERYVRLIEEKEKKSLEKEKKDLEKEKIMKWKDYVMNANARLGMTISQEREKAKRIFSECDPEVVMLGTSSMTSTEYRNVSSIYLRFWQNNDYGILMDCGEGTYSQIMNHYGLQKGEEYLMNIKIVFITHIHGDHHLGLLQLLKERQEIYKKRKKVYEPMYLIIPFNLITWLHKYTTQIETTAPAAYFHIVFSQFIDANVNRANMAKIIEKNRMSRSKGQYQQEQQPQQWWLQGPLDDKEDKVKRHDDDGKEEKEESKSQARPLLFQKGGMKKVKRYSDVANEVNGDDVGAKVEEVNEADDEIEGIYYDDPEVYGLVKEYYEESIKNQENMKRFLGNSMHIESLNSIPVDHCPQAYGIRFKHLSGWSLLYTGDTRYSKSLITQCKDTTILIHEATFKAGESNEAYEKLHSTMLDAIKTGLNMGAWRTIITHFSAKYSKGYDHRVTDNEKEVLDDGIRANRAVNNNDEMLMDMYRRKNMVIGMDHLRFKLSDLGDLPYRSKTMNIFQYEFVRESERIIRRNG